MGEVFIIMEFTIEQEIEHIQMGKPHVVILGAGASLAAFPNGDKKGRKLPLMDNIIEVLDMKNLLSQTEIEFESKNFEIIYAQICKMEKYQKLRQAVEQTVYSYFSDLEISDSPTLYDHLLLSLRPKDIVATFNWDPFLLQAYRRNIERFTLPRVLFLHGNVGIGFCEKDMSVGVNGHLCKMCGEYLEPTKLFYPIAEKNYHLDGFISAQWNELDFHLKQAFMITIFGYGAPKSDVSAIDLLKSAWGDVNQREMEQTEIIDIKTDDELRTTWRPFIHTHHYETHADFYASWTPNHPRRTGEAYINQYWNAYFIESNPIPKDLPFEALWEWIDALQQVEITKENI